ncbi:MAG: DUF4292 domain-containing protein [Candidatus Eisenbacteria bacterium]|nr:DUF4292 domain-containing protein [Candidatus Eisenbacteria bacterium]
MQSLSRRTSLSRGPADRNVILPILVAAFLVASLCTSCAVSPPVQTAGEKRPCSAKTMNLLKKEAPEIRSVKATLDVYLSFEEPRRSERLQVGLVAQEPDRMRLNVYAGFVSLASVALDGDSIRAFIPSSSVLLAGSLGDAVTQALLPEATGLLLDAVRTVLFPKRFCVTECMSEEIEKGRCRFEEDSDDGKRIGIVDSKTGNLIRLEFVDADGAERVGVDYRDYTRSGGVLFPHEITVSLPSDGVRARLVFNRTVLNDDIDEKVFRLKDLFPLAD